jgi:tetratricopeptide (TPR) repeat protein
MARLHTFSRYAPLPRDLHITLIGHVHSLTGIQTETYILCCFQNYTCYLMDEETRQALEWFDRGVKFERLGRHEEAIAAFDSAIAIAPGLAFPWYVRGNAMYELGHFSHAIEAYKKALELDPDYADAWNNLGLSAFKLHHYADALAAFDEAIARDPSNAFSWNNRGVVLQIQKKNEEAIDAFNHAVAIDPTYSEPLINKSNALLALGRYSDVICTYDAILRLDPRNAQIWHDKGHAQALIERHEDALESFNKALTLEPKNTKILVQKAKTLYTLKNFPEAIAVLDRVLFLDDTNVLAWTTKGHALTRLYKYREADEAFNRALAIDPSSSQAISGQLYAQKKLTGTQEGKSLGQMIIHRQVLVPWGTLMVLIVIAIIVIPTMITLGYFSLLPVSTGPQHPTPAMSPSDVCIAAPTGSFYKESLIDPVPIVQRTGEWSYTYKPVARSTIIGQVAIIKSYFPVPPGEFSPFDLTVVNGELMDQMVLKNIPMTLDGRRVTYTSKLPQSATQLGQVYLFDHIRSYSLITADDTTRDIILNLSEGDEIMIYGYEVEAFGTGPDGETRYAASKPGSSEQSRAASELTFVESIRILPCHGRS